MIVCYSFKFMIIQTIYDIIGIIEELKREIVLRTKLNTETERQTICKKYQIKEKLNMLNMHLNILIRHLNIMSKI